MQCSKSTGQSEWKIALLLGAHRGTTIHNNYLNVFLLCARDTTKVLAPSFSTLVTLAFRGMMFSACWKETIQIMGDNQTHSTRQTSLSSGL